MSNVIAFPIGRRIEAIARAGPTWTEESGLVLILPVIRIEREGPDDAPGRRRRRDRVSMADMPVCDPNRALNRWLDEMPDV